MPGVSISRYCPLTSRRLWSTSTVDSPQPSIMLPIRKGGVTGRVGDFGWTRVDRHGNAQAHTGVDLLTPVGWPVFAAHAGKITSARKSGKAGLRIKLVSDQGEDPDGRSPDGCTGTRYAHLDSMVVEAGDRVVQGQFMARTGRTGNVGDDVIVVPTHLHFSVRVKISGVWMLVDPWEWLQGVPQPRMFAELEKPGT